MGSYSAGGLGQSSAGSLSVGNSTSTPLVSGSVFTGVAEDVSGFSTITVFIHSDTESAHSGLSMQFSTDGVNWDRAITHTIHAGPSHAHSLLVVSKYFRVVYTNGSVSQTEFRLQVLYHVTKERSLTSGIQQTLGDHEDVTLVRAVSSPILDRNVGNISYQETIQKFGRNPSVGNSSYENIWYQSGVYTFLTASSPLRVRTGGNVNDQLTGSGARSIRLEGLDDDFLPLTEDINLSGAAQSSPTTGSFRRLNRGYVYEVGTYGTNNTGDILVETSSDGTLQGSIASGSGQTQLGHYSVKASGSAYITKIRLFVDSSASKTATVRLFKRERANLIVAPFGPKRQIQEWTALAGAIREEYDSWIKVPNKSDIFFEAIGSAAGGTPVDVSFDMIIVDTEELT